MTSFHWHSLKMSKCSTRKPFCGRFEIHTQKLIFKTSWRILAEKMTLDITQSFHRDVLPILENQLSVGRLVGLLCREIWHFWLLIFHLWRVWKLTNCWKCHKGRSIVEKNLVIFFLSVEKTRGKKVGREEHTFEASFLRPYILKFQPSIGYHGSVRWILDQTRKSSDLKKV